MPVVSVIVPVYNADEYLPRCIDSVLRQSFGDFELILIDDGSTDKSASICDLYKSKDPRINVIHKPNEGVSSARNLGLSTSRGEYVSFVDADDYVAADYLQTLLAKAKEADSDMIICRYLVDKCGVFSSVDMTFEADYLTPDAVKTGLLSLYYKEYRNGLYSVCNKLIKREVFERGNIRFDVSLKRGEDAWFVFRCLQNCDRVNYIPDELYYYFQNNESVMHKTDYDQYDKWVAFRKRLLSANEEIGFEIDYNSFYKDFLYKTAVFCRLLFKKKKKDAALTILGDDFYKGALKYRKKLPMHIKTIGALTIVSPVLASTAYKIWSAFSD